MINLEFEFSVTIVVNIAVVLMKVSLKKATNSKVNIYQCDYSKTWKWYDLAPSVLPNL